MTIEVKESSSTNLEEFITRQCKVYLKENPTEVLSLLRAGFLTGYWQIVNSNDFEHIIMWGKKETYEVARKVIIGINSEGVIGTAISGNVRKRSKIIQEVEKTLNERQENYAPPTVNFKHIALVWSDLLGTKITARDVALMMMELKIIREKHAHTFDNLLDIVGYVLCLEEIEDDV